jgi:hypothetical protein
MITLESGLALICLGIFGQGRVDQFADGVVQQQVAFLDAGGDVAGDDELDIG